MAKDTPSMAKNKMKRCFKAILVPHTTKQEENQLWEFFDSTCAYCDKSSETHDLIMLEDVGVQTFSRLFVARNVDLPWTSLRSNNVVENGR